MTRQEIYAHIDHTILSAVATRVDVQSLCEEAIKYKMASVCIPPSFVKHARDSFEHLNICTVVGFPLGYNTTEVKVNETKTALAEGADEVDMVINLTDAKAGNFDRVTAEIMAIKAAAGNHILKVIIETCYLTESEKIALCHCVTDGGADYIKTSTGFGTAGATLEDVRLLKKHIGPNVKIKASGGIKTRQMIEQFLSEGCERIGTSSAVSMLTD